MEEKLFTVQILGKEFKVNLEQYQIINGKIVIEGTIQQETEEVN